MARWQTLLDEIRVEQIEIMRDWPYKDVGLVPNPGAAETAIAAAEARLGIGLPPSYRSFLAHHDGWPRFYEGANLLGTAHLGVRQYDDWVQAVFQAAETPAPDDGPPSVLRRKPLIPFGVDLQGTTMFAFDSSQRTDDGELRVVAWVNEIGLSFPTFEDFLENVRDWCRAELDSCALMLDQRSA